MRRKVYKPVARPLTRPDWKRKPRRALDADHKESQNAFDHCPCWYEGKLCCFCHEEKPACTS